MGKSNRALVIETIELERSLMKYKRGLHLAKKFIDSHVGDPDMNTEMIENYKAYTLFLSVHNLEGI